MNESITRKTCPLRNDWRDWSQEKQSDRLFMLCPACKVYGSHIGEAEPTR